MIYIDTEQLQDGLYNIKDGKIYKYKAKGGTVRAYKLKNRPQGKWIFRREFVEDTPFTGYRCSNCNYWKGMGAWNFCPNCGARMKGADDE